VSEPLYFLSEARRLLAEFPASPGTPLLTLTGELGMGKTSFAKTLLHEGWGLDPARVQSPTFLKLLEYDLPGFGRAVHIDGYRTEDADEWDRVGLEAYENVRLWIVEWPETFMEYLAAREGLRHLLDIQGAWELFFERGSESDEEKMGPIRGPGGRGDGDSGLGEPIRRLGWRRKSF